jgi:hypothetical protein
MIWGQLCPTHGERGAKPLESKAAAANVGCCVLWLCFVLWLAVVEHFCRVEHLTHTDMFPLF